MTSDLDLTEAVEAAAIALYIDKRLWDAFTEDEKRNGKPRAIRQLVAEIAIEAAAPLIARNAARAEREKAAQELIAWADEIVEPGISGPRAIRRRTLMAAASKITPKLTPAELAEKIATGEAHVIHCTALDIEPEVGP